MNARRPNLNAVRRLLPLAIALACPLWVGFTASADEALGPQPTWKPRTAADLRGEVLAYVAARNVDEAQKREAAGLWPETPEANSKLPLLDRLAETFALVDPEVRKLVVHCTKATPVAKPLDIPWLTDDSVPPLVRHNLALYYGRWLAQHDLYDESLVYLSPLTAEQVADPAALLFFQSVAHHRLVNPKESRAAAQKLLEREAELPQRYRQLAALMAEDVKEIDPDSLDHISRRMEDIRRRLDLGRAGKKVREVEDGVIASLDKLIDELEQQQQQQQQQQSNSGAPPAPGGKPLDQSQIAPLKGPGKVDAKNVGKSSGWGALPPKQREAALQQIGKEFPAHFRDAIEQYFRKIASEEGEGESK